MDCLLCLWDFFLPAFPGPLSVLQFHSSLQTQCSERDGNCMLIFSESVKWLMLQSVLMISLFISSMISIEFMHSYVVLPILNMAGSLVVAYLSRSWLASISLAFWLMCLGYVPFIFCAWNVTRKGELRLLELFNLKSLLSGNDGGFVYLVFYALPICTFSLQVAWLYHYFAGQRSTAIPGKA